MRAQQQKQAVSKGLQKEERIVVPEAVISDKEEEKPVESEENRDGEI